MSVSNRPISQAYQTKAQFAFQRLRQAILDGELMPGEKILQAKVALELNISLIPVREALQTLEAQGYIKIIPRHGVIVNQHSAEEIKEIYVVLLPLEELAAGIIAKEITGRHLTLLHQILQEASAALKAQNAEQLATLDEKFHRTACEASNHPLLCRLIQDLRARCERYPVASTAIHQRTAIEIWEHQRMLHAWEQRDSNAAEMAACQHVMSDAKSRLAAMGSETEIVWSYKTVSGQNAYPSNSKDGREAPSVI